jgi:hypothetical protein
MTQGHVVSPALMNHIDNGKELSQAVQAEYGTDTVASRDCSLVMTDGLLTGREMYGRTTVLAFQDYFSQL